MDVVERLKSGVLSHSCHCADPRADGYVGASRSVCYGAVGLMLNSNDFIVPESLDINTKEVDSSLCFKSSKDFVLHHLNAIKSKTKDVTK
jgi:hypothetical protein